MYQSLVWTYTKQSCLPRLFGNLRPTTDPSLLHAFGHLLGRIEKLVRTYELLRQPQPLIAHDRIHVLKKPGEQFYMSFLAVLGLAFQKIARSRPSCGVVRPCVGGELGVL